MRLSPAFTLALTVLLVTAVLGVVAASPPAHPVMDDHSPSSQAAVTVAPPALEAADPQQVIRINITDDGDTHWTIESRFRLTDANDTEAFFAYAKAVTAGDRNAGYDAAQFDRFAREAAASTDREMAIKNGRWDQPRTESVDGDEAMGDDDESAVQVGVVSYSFTWTNFATVTEDRIYVGDAFETADGTWFSTLAAGQRLIIESPSNYGFDTAPPGGSEGGALVLDGPRHFEQGDLEIVLLRGAGEPPSSSSVGYPVVVGVALGVLVTVALFFLVVRGRQQWSVGDGTQWSWSWPWTADASDGDASSPDATTEQPADGDAGASRPEAALAYDETEDVAEDAVDVELLSDEERVRRLLRTNGGRMKQASIVTETGWSNAKVSQLLSKMDDRDQIEKLRIGRENLITLPGIDPTEIE